MQITCDVEKLNSEENLARQREVVARIRHGEQTAAPADELAELVHARFEAEERSRCFAVEREQLVATALDEKANDEDPGGVELPAYFGADAARVLEELVYHARQAGLLSQPLGFEAHVFPLADDEDVTVLIVVEQADGRWNEGRIASHTVELGKMADVHEADGAAIALDLLDGVVALANDLLPAARALAETRR